MSNEILKNDTAITLDWADVATADAYHIQVSDQPDFSGVLMIDDDSLAVSTKSFTDTGDNNTRRFWRWRYSADLGATWSAWSEVGSYWYNTSFSTDLALSGSQWVFINPNDITDKYVLTTFPMYIVSKGLIERLRTRNRKATLLSEYVTVKDGIVLTFDDLRWMTHEQMREITRFHTELKTFFLATLKSNGVDSVPNVWKVQFQTDPVMNMIAAGRQDIMVGDLTLEEV